MIILITGATHTGKTRAARNLLKKFGFNYIGTDYLKMGLIRSKNTSLTPYDDEKLTDFLWPITREIIKTAVENRQNLTIEGCYVPPDWKNDFGKEYLAHIRFYCLAMTDKYIYSRFKDIIKHANDAETRKNDDSSGKITPGYLVSENKKYINAFYNRGCGYNAIISDTSYNSVIDPYQIAESERLIFRLMKKRDYADIEEMLKDPEVMYAWERTFSEREISEWIKKRLTGYSERGYDYFLAVDKRSGETVGQIGLLSENIDGKTRLGLGYMLKKKFFGKGFAEEGALTMLKYAFDYLGSESVIAEIRPQNFASRKVAEKLGMKITGETIKVWDDKKMPHLTYEIKKEDYFSVKKSL